MFSTFKVIFSDPLDVQQGTTDVAVLDEERRKIFMYSVLYDLNHFTGVHALPCITPEDEPHAVPTSFESMKKVIEEESREWESKVKIVTKKDLTFADLVESMKADLKDAPRNEKASIMAQLFSCMG